MIHFKALAIGTAIIAAVVAVIYAAQSFGPWVIGAVLVIPMAWMIGLSVIACGEEL